MSTQRTSIVFTIGILLSCSIDKSWTTSSNEYWQSEQCQGDSNLTDKEAVNEYIKNYGIDRLDHFIKARLDHNRKIPLKIAITGKSGSGKSTLVNTFRGLRPDDIVAATVGATETKEEIHMYTHPKHRNLRFYDLPGVGTMNFPKERYLELIDYKRYDFFIIVSSDPFTENDLWLSEEVKKDGKAFFFVRSKVNLDLANEKRDHPKRFNEARVLNELRNECSKFIKKTDPTANIFLISGLLEDRDKFDYTRMESTLISSFPIYKRQALIMTMTMTGKEGMRAKVEALKSNTWMIGILSAGCGAVPVPGIEFAVDYMAISWTISNYKSVLGLDDVSLERLAKMHDLTLDEVNEKLTGGWTGSLLRNDVQKYVIKSIEKYVKENTVEKFARYIPILGQAYSAWKAATTTMAVLHHSLDEMSKAADSIIDLIK